MVSRVDQKVRGSFPAPSNLFLREPTSLNFDHHQKRNGGNKLAENLGLF